MCGNLAMHEATLRGRVLSAAARSGPTMGMTLRRRYLHARQARRDRVPRLFDPASIMRAYPAITHAAYPARIHGL